MNRFPVIIVLLLCGGLTAKAQRANPWLDSTQANYSKAPLCIANGIIVNPTELNVDFIASMNVVNAHQSKQRWGHLSDNGCIYVEVDQQFDVITPRLYQKRKKLPSSVQTVFYMLNGTMIPDTVRISKASIRRVDILLGANQSGVSTTSACLSIWTLSNEERGLPRPKNEVHIQGAKAGE